MPKKTNKNTTTPNPTQGQVARLITDTLELLENQILTSLIEDQELGLTRDTLLAINKKIKIAGADMKEKSINNLLGYYR